jgi:redox-sensitive bicupin YhaK (pirin superfamily)
VPPASKRGALSQIAGPQDALVKIHADASLYAGLFDGDETATLSLKSGRKAYVHLVRGEVQVNGHALKAGGCRYVGQRSPNCNLTWCGCRSIRL